MLGAADYGMPSPTVTLQQTIRTRRPRAARRVRLRPGLVLGQCIKERLHRTPSGLDRVGALEQGLIPAQHVVEQGFVPGQMRQFGTIVAIRQRSLLGGDLQPRTLMRMPMSIPSSGWIWKIMRLAGR